MGNLRDFLPRVWRSENDMLNFMREPLFLREPFFFSDTQMFHVDMKETANEIIVEADLPGFQKDQVSLELEGVYLTISAEKHEEKEERDEANKYLHRERNYGSVRRTLMLPAEVDKSKARAELNNGLLKLTLPKIIPIPSKSNRIPIE